MTTARVRVLALVGAAVSFALAVFIVLAVGLPGRPVSGPSAAPVKGAVAPSFSALDEAAGHPVVLNFWATWCGPCAAEMPDLQAFYAKYREQGLHVIGINVDEPEEVFRPWAESRAVTFQLLPDPAERLQTIYEIRGVPQTFLIDPDGLIVEVYFGPVTLTRLETALQRWLR